MIMLGLCTDRLGVWSSFLSECAYSHRTSLLEVPSRGTVLIGYTAADTNDDIVAALASMLSPVSGTDIWCHI